MGWKRHHGTRKFIVTRFDTGTHESRAFPVRAPDKAAAREQVERAGMTGIQVQTVAGYYLRRMAMIGSMIALGLALASAVIITIGWWQKNVTTYDTLLGSTNLAITATKGDAGADVNTRQRASAADKKNNGPSLTEQARAAKSASTFDLGEDEGLFPSPALKRREPKIDQTMLTPEQMLKLVDPIGQRPRSLVHQDRSWIVGAQADDADDCD